MTCGLTSVSIFGGGLLPSPGVAGALRRAGGCEGTGLGRVCASVGGEHLPLRKWNAFRCSGELRAFHLAESQAFYDGNKRTAAAAALAFLRRNGKAMIVDDGTLYDAMMAIAKKTMDKRGLAAVLSRLCDQGANDR